MGKRPFIVSDRGLNACFGNRPFVTEAQANLIGEEYVKFLSKMSSEDAKIIERLATLVTSLFYKSYDTDLIQKIRSAGLFMSTVDALSVVDEEGEFTHFQGIYYSEGFQKFLPISDPLIVNKNSEGKCTHMRFPDVRWEHEKYINGGFFKSVKKDDPELLEAVALRDRFEASPVQRVGRRNSALAREVAGIALCFMNERDFLQEFPLAEEALNNAKVHEAWQVNTIANEDDSLKKLMAGSRREIRREIWSLTNDWI